MESPPSASLHRIGPLSLRQIEVFHAIILTGTLSDAGRLLHVSQPAISRVLSHMEQRLGYALFHRHKGRLQATPEAQRLTVELQSIHEGVVRLNDLALAMGRRDEGLISIVSSPSFSEWLVPEAAARFKQRYPKVAIKYRTMGMDNLIPHLLAGHADIAISLAKPEHPNIISRALRHGNIFCAIPESHPLVQQQRIEPQHLQEENLIGYSRDTPLGETINHYWNSHNIRLDVAIEVRSPQSAFSFVRRNLGIALVDSYGLTVSNLQGVCIRPIHPAIPLSVYVNHTKLTPPSSLAQDFIQEFSTVLKTNLKTNTQTLLEQ
ncbi:LysR substrate-binding domain-containing protein [Paenalcaligenes suwonensis]|uniref:LysR substrate-binding domain-containing protein n=1 Tax=Paenalcaligenes suwonensis TaxID=1202713 RepID=UPI00140CCB1E|nr:LysR substrate-binding domain-containing protein [Paenalcaligenes suwonensis]NHC62843.1 LysR family transcriptional regulator [Paenalcaligenes suwonensis]